VRKEIARKHENTTRELNGMDNLTRRIEPGNEELKARTVGEANNEKRKTPAFRNLESWDLTMGEEVQGKKDAFLEETIRKQAEYNMRLQEKVLKDVPQKEINSAAGVSQPPVQEFAARESWKQHRERQKKLKLARKLCPVGDEFTLDISKSIIEMRQAKENSLSAAGVNEQKTQEDGVDFRVLGAFCRGFRKNRKGKPESKTDEAARKEDMEFLKDYLSGDKDKRLPHLQRAVREILQMRFTPEMLAPEYVFKNIVVLIEMLDKITCIEKMIKENPEFFSSLPPLERDLIDANEKIAKHFSGYVTAMIGSKGVGINRGDIYGEEYEQLPGVETLESVRENFREAIMTFREDVNAAFNREVDRRYEEHKPGVMLGCLQMEDRLRRERDPRAGIRFTSPTVNMTLRDNVYNVRKLIEENQENYLKNKDMLDKLYAEFFKCNDTMAGIAFDLNILQRGSDEFNQMQPEYKKELADAFANRQGECFKRHDIMQKRAEALKNVIEHYLSGMELTPMGKEIMKEYT